MTSCKRGKPVNRLCFFVVGMCFRQVVVPVVGDKLGHQQGLGRVTLFCVELRLFFPNLSAVLSFWQEFSEWLKRCLVNYKGGAAS